MQCRRSNRRRRPEDEMDSIVLFTARMSTEPFPRFPVRLWWPLQAHHRKFVSPTKFRQPIVPHVHPDCAAVDPQLRTQPADPAALRDRCVVPIIGRKTGLPGATTQLRERVWGVSGNSPIVVCRQVMMVPAPRPRVSRCLMRTTRVHQIDCTTTYLGPSCGQRNALSAPSPRCYATAGKSDRQRTGTSRRAYR